MGVLINMIRVCATINESNRCLSTIWKNLFSKLSSPRWCTKRREILDEVFYESVLWELLLLINLNQERTTCWIWIWLTWSGRRINSNIWKTNSYETWKKWLKCILIDPYNVSNHWNSNVNLNYSFCIIHSNMSKEILNFFFKWKRRNMEESRATINNKQAEEKNWISPTQLSSFLRFKYPNCLNFSLPSSHKWERLRVNWLESSRLEINSTSSTRAFINVLKLQKLECFFPIFRKKKKKRKRDRVFDSVLCVVSQSDDIFVETKRREWTSLKKNTLAPFNEVLLETLPLWSPICTGHAFVYKL